MFTQPHQHQSGRTNAGPAIDVFERARTAAIAMVERVAYPHRGIASRAAMVARDMLTCADHDFNEPELMNIPMMLIGVIHDRFHPLTPKDEHMARRLESEADQREDHSQDMLFIEGETPATLEAHAADLERVAVRSLYLARVERAKARRMRVDAEVQRRITIERLTGQENR